MARSRVTVRVDGIPEARTKIRNITEQTANEIVRTVFESAQNIETRAKRLAPVDTGNLRGRIETEIKDRGFTADVISNAEYSAYVEFGTRRHFPPPGALAGWARRHGMSGQQYLIARAIARRGTKAQPYMVPAFEKERRQFTSKIKRILQNID